MKPKNIAINLIIVLAIGIIAGFTYNMINRLSYGNVFIEGVYPDGTESVYAFSL